MLGQQTKEARTMIGTAPTERIVSQDDRISVLMSFLLPDEPIKINLSGKTGVLMDENAYDGLLETIRILQENPSIVESLDERENGIFVDESEIEKYV
jgi:hypothetical protein